MFVERTLSFFVKLNFPSFFYYILKARLLCAIKCLTASAYDCTTVIFANFLLMVRSFCSSISGCGMSIVLTYCISGFVRVLILSSSMFNFAVGSSGVSKFLIFDLNGFSCSLSFNERSSRVTTF